MQRKTKHRLLGFLVILGLAVILLPFLQGGKDVPVPTQLVQAPTFPDQSNADAKDGSSINLLVASEASPQSDAAPALDNPTTDLLPQDATIDTKTDDAVVTPAAPDLTPSDANADQAIQPPAVENNQDQIAATPDTVVTTPPSVEQPVATTDAAPLKEPAVTNSDKTETTKSVTEAPIAKVAENTPAKIDKKVASAVKQLVTNNKITLQAPSANERKLAKLGQSAWVVQVATFKNNENANRMLNKLRAKGYKAFTKHITVSGELITKVMVGPEGAKLAANELADKLHGDTSLNVVVVHYKPLVL